MKSFQEYLIEQGVLKNTLATAMLSASAVNSTGIPVERIPSIVHDYWQEELAPTPKQELTKLTIKHKAHAKNGILDTETIPHEIDRHRFRQLMLQLAHRGD